MLSWILIALAIAVIFGVISVDSIKNLSAKLQPELCKFFAEIQNKITAEKNKTQQSETKKNDTAKSDNSSAE